jgi:uncharacterized caspase-like protein
MRALAVLVAAAFWFLAGLLAGPACAGDGVALIIGNDDYAYAPQLRNARNDAQRIASVLKKLGYEVIEAYDADERKMAEAMDTFAEKVKSARIGLVYYAGHGIQYQGDAYLVPVDLNLNSERDLRKTIPAQYLVSDAATASELGIVILDACRDNPFVKQIAEDLGPTRSMSVSRGLARVNTAPAKSLIAYATQTGNVALDGEGPNSPYAQSLAEHLATPNLDVRLIFGAVRDEVVQMTGGKQEPYIYGSLGGDEIYLSREQNGANGDNTSPGHGGLAAVDMPSIGNLGSLPQDYAAWKDALATDDWQTFAKFVSAYPDSLFTAVARLLVAREAAYQRPSEALAAEVATHVTLAALPNASVAAIQAGLRNVDYSSEANNGIPGPKLKTALAAFAQAELGGPSLTVGVLAALADRAAIRGAASPLTGSWKGHYEYPNGSGRTGVDFSQDLTFSQGLITGYVSEPNTFGDKTSKNLYASLTGAVSGNDIQWVKTYDGTGGVSHSVTYQGKVDRKAGKIVGKWQIKADWSGPFELSRE